MYRNRKKVRANNICRTFESVRKVQLIYNSTLNCFVIFENKLFKVSLLGFMLKFVLHTDQKHNQDLAQKLLEVTWKMNECFDIKQSLKYCSSCLTSNRVFGVNGTSLAQIAPKFLWSHLDTITSCLCSCVRDPNDRFRFARYFMDDIFVKKCE